MSDKNINNVLKLKDEHRYSWGPYAVTSENQIITEWIQDRKGGYYAVAIDGKIQKYRMVTIGNQEIGLDRSYRSLVKEGIITSPEDITLGDDLMAVYVKIYSFLKETIYFEEEEDYDASTAYAILSWLYDRYDSIPYLRFTGDFGTGKSTALKAMSMICYRAIMTAGAITTAPLFRIAKKVKGTFIIDEADFKNSDMESDLIKILNSGYSKGFPVMRMGRNMEPELFHVFGPKIIGTRERFTDNALESRCITIAMTPAYVNVAGLDSDRIVKMATDVRNRMITFRLGLTDSEEGDESVDKIIQFSGWEPRIKQIARPLLEVTPEERRDKLTTVLNRANENFSTLRHTTIQAEIIKAFIKLGGGRVLIKDIQLNIDEEFEGRYSNRALSALAQNMGFATEKTNSGIAVVASIKTLDKLKKQYKVAEVEGKQERIDYEEIQ